MTAKKTAQTAPASITVKPYSKGVVVSVGAKEVARVTTAKLGDDPEMALFDAVLDSKKCPADLDDSALTEAIRAYVASLEPQDEPQEAPKVEPKPKGKGKATVNAEVKPAAKPEAKEGTGTVPRRAKPAPEGWELPLNPLHSFKVLSQHPNAATDTNDKGEIVGFQCLRAVESCTEVCKGGIARRCHAMLALSKRTGRDVLRDMDTLWDLGDEVDAMSVGAQKALSDAELAKLSK